MTNEIHEFSENETFIRENYFSNWGQDWGIEFNKLKTIPWEKLPEDCLGSFLEIENWINHYLIKPHPLLGRPGPVCPFVKKSVAKGLFYVSGQYEAKYEIEDLCNIVLRWKKIFKSMYPTSGGDSTFRTVILVFTELEQKYADKLFQSVLDKCKSDFVDDGLMLGEFHSGPPEKYGIHNESFKPLFSPLPILAIREMVETDQLFLKNNSNHFKAFIERFRIQ